jgi:hypothetical protein
MPAANPSNNLPSAGSGQGAGLTPELVKKVADKVYAMLLADLRLEAERQHRTPGSRAIGSRGKGGR